MKEYFVWNVGRTACTRGSRIRNFTIDEVKTNAGVEKNDFKVTAWFSDNETFVMGMFEIIDEARAFVERVTTQLEG
jgi:hypothetical protein